MRAAAYARVSTQRQARAQMTGQQLDHSTACVLTSPASCEAFDPRSAHDQRRTRGHSLSANGRKAWSPGIVAVTFARSHSPRDSDGVFTCIK